MNTPRKLGPPIKNSNYYRNRVTGQSEFTSDELRLNAFTNLQNLSKTSPYGGFPVRLDARGNLYPTSAFTLRGQFGGDGTDGDLIVSSGTTTINLANASVVVKNYRQIRITGSGAVAFSNPATGGTIITFLCKGDCHINTSANPAIDLRSLGGAGGLGATAGAQTDTSPLGGGGGASATTSGTTGGGSGAGNNVARNTGNPGGSFGQWLQGSISGGAAGIGTTNASGGITPGINTTSAKNVKWMVYPGSGGGGGKGVSAGGNGGAGGGALYMEVAGAYNNYSVINASGSVGADGANNGGAGGGGGGGSIVIFYNRVGTDAGTYTVTGGAGGAGGGGNGGAGGAGGNGFSLIAQNLTFASQQ